MTARYESYLQSSHWQRTRDEMVVSAGGVCEFCGRGGPLHVHHVTYERLWRERPTDLIVLCASCHADAHEFPKRLEEIRRYIAIARAREVLP